MQVYLALTDGKNVMIVKKRKRNQWWKSKLSPKPTVVNGAGNYAFPGGGLNTGENSVDGAKREFSEESGFKWDILPVGAVVSTWENTQPQQYKLVMITLKPDWYNRVVAQAKQNVEGNGSKPPGQVKDWEWDVVQSVEKRALSQYLGVEQLTPQEKTQLEKNSKQWSQSIDWYGEMARLAATRFDWRPA